jgi:hypothetical protein
MSVFANSRQGKEFGSSAKETTFFFPHFLLDSVAMRCYILGATEAATTKVYPPGGVDMQSHGTMRAEQNVFCIIVGSERIS